MLTDTYVSCTCSASCSALFFSRVIAAEVLCFFATAAAGDGESGVPA